MNVFNSAEDVLRLYECLEEMLDHIEAQAEEGYKFNLKDKEVNAGAPFKLYVNDYAIGDNIIMPVLNNKPMVFLAHSFINYTFTKNDTFCEYIYEYFKKTIRKSTLISSVSEKQRRIFFNPIRENLSKRKETLHY
ncbi:MAG: hypothetical protein ACR2KX_02935 [Chitinophagaceae bacterium]